MDLRNHYVALTASSFKIPYLESVFYKLTDVIKSRILFLIVCVRISIVNWESSSSCGS